MVGKTILYNVVIFMAIVGNVLLALAAGVSLTAKQWPASYFYRYQKISIREKEKLLGNIAAVLNKINKDGHGLIVKGAIIDEIGTDKRIYERLTILDESGLIIFARKVPNIYYNYRSKSPLNPNIYLVIKNAKVNALESYIRYGFVVEGDFWGYADKFVTAIMEGLENPDPHQE